MLSQEKLTELLAMGEDCVFEAKEAHEGFPKSFWPSYSAFANTRGGFIVLGVKEKRRNYFEVIGIQNIAARKEELWNLLHSREKVSINLISNEDVAVKKVNGKSVLLVRVPEANRQQRPVFLHGNPLRETYKRGHAGDYHCTEDEVRRMLRDASDDVFDAAVRSKFSLDDLDQETVRAYRQIFQNRTPDHPWSNLGDALFLEKICAWRKDRDSRQEGLTVAGLLMFGKSSSIREAFPHFFLDYQEQLSADPETRWTHRITFDGLWEINLFNFYNRVIHRLVMDLNVPFKLQPDLVRSSETHVHQALREALINTLIHADHSSSRNILMVKRPDGFYFSNPGRLRLPLEQIYRGGKSDCRNTTLQTMFTLIGLGEKAGSGISRILRAWEEQEWLKPLIRDNLDLEMTECLLLKTSMIPDFVLNELKARFGEKFVTSDEVERMALVLAHQFQSVSNTELQRYCRKHPVDIGKKLKGLVTKGLLIKQNEGPATIYRLTEKDSLHKPGDSLHKPGDSLHKPGDSLHKDEVLWKKLEELALSVKDRKRVPPSELKELIIQLCRLTPLSTNQIADLTGRKSNTLYLHYLRLLIKDGSLQLLYPDQRNRPDQAYRAGK